MVNLNLYDILAVSTSATQDEIRRAYRILARRYHPDLHPPHSSSPSEINKNRVNLERFKQIASAYETLSDPEKRACYDAEFHRTKAEKRYSEAEMRFRAKKAQASYKDRAFYSHQSKRVRPESENTLTEKKNLGAKNKLLSNFSNFVRDYFIKGVSKLGRSNSQRLSKLSRKISVIEVSISIQDGLLGGKKIVEITEPEGQRKVAITIPENVRSGTVVRLRDTAGRGEELVAIIRVASHPFISLEARGIVVEVPLSIEEAAKGAKIILPTLDESQLVTFPAGTQSGDEVRLKYFGIKFKNGSRGDIFYRALIKIPDADLAVGFNEALQKVCEYYQKSVRYSFPSKLIS